MKEVEQASNKSRTNKAQAHIGQQGFDEWKMSDIASVSKPQTAIGTCPTLHFAVGKPEVPAWRDRARTMILRARFLCGVHRYLRGLHTCNTYCTMAGRADASDDVHRQMQICWHWKNNRSVTKDFHQCNIRESQRIASNLESASRVLN